MGLKSFPGFTASSFFRCMAVLRGRNKRYESPAFILMSRFFGQPVQIQAVVPEPVTRSGASR